VKADEYELDGIFRTMFFISR